MPPYFPFRYLLLQYKFILYFLSMYALRAGEFLQSLHCLTLNGVMLL